MKSGFKITLLVFTALVVSFASADAETKVPSLTLADTIFELAHTESANETVLNEYLPQGQKLKNWKFLFAVRHVRNAKNVDEVVSRWKAFVAQVRSPGKKLSESEDSTEFDRRFNLAIRAPQDAFLESSSIRFIPDPGGNGVIYYQVAVRMNPRDESDLLQGFLDLGNMSQAMKSLTLGVHTSGN